jgi:hypothetical protein
MKEYTFRPIAVGPNYRRRLGAGIALLTVWIGLLAALPAIGQTLHSAAAERGVPHSPTSVSAGPIQTIS